MVYPGHDTYQELSYFRSERLYCQSSIDGEDEGWWFTLRGGHVYGPYENKAAAEESLAELVRIIQKNRGVTRDVK